MVRTPVEDDVNYVMVPVPEKLVGEVMEFILRRSVKTRKAAEPKDLGAWSPESMQQLFLEANEPTRALLSYMALPSNAGKQIAVSDVARALELSVPDLSGIVGPLNKRSKRTFQLVPPVESTRKDRGEHGRRPVRTLLMTEEVAVMVRAAEQHALAVEPNEWEQA